MVNFREHCSVVAALLILSQFLPIISNEMDTVVLVHSLPGSNGIWAVLREILGLGSIFAQPTQSSFLHLCSSHYRTAWTLYTTDHVLGEISPKTSDLDVPEPNKILASSYLGLQIFLMLTAN